MGILQLASPIFKLVERLAPSSVIQRLGTQGTRALSSGAPVAGSFFGGASKGITAGTLAGVAGFGLGGAIGLPKRRKRKSRRKKKKSHKRRKSKRRRRR